MKVDMRSSLSTGKLSGKGELCEGPTTFLQVVAGTNYKLLLDIANSANKLECVEATVYGKKTGHLPYLFAYSSSLRAWRVNASTRQSSPSLMLQS